MRAVRHWSSVIAMVGVLVGCSQTATPRSPTPAGIAPEPTKAHETDRRNLGWPVWIGIVCDDFEAQRHFYRDVLGLREHVTSADSVWFDLEGKQLELLAKSQRPQYAQRGVAVGFVVADIHQARTQLLQRSVEPVGEIEGGPDEYWAYFRDADGNLFEIVQRAVH